MCLLFNSLKTSVIKHNIKFSSENESLLMMNITFLILEKSKQYFLALKEKTHSLNIFWSHSKGMSHQGKWMTTTNRQIHNKELSVMFETTSLSSSIKSFISILEGKERISKFHSKLISIVLQKGFQCPIQSMLEFYGMLILSTQFEYVQNEGLRPIIKFRYLYELICLEQIFSNSPQFSSFTLFWRETHEKLTYLIEMLNYSIGNDNNFKHTNLMNFLKTVKGNHDVFSMNDSIERENLRLKVIENFLTFWNNSNSEKTLVYILAKDIIQKCINQFFILDFVKFAENENKNEDQIEIGASVISKSIIGDDSILGSVNFFDNNNNQSFVKSQKEGKFI